MSSVSLSSPIRVGLVGTGYAAKMRAETLKADSRAKLITVAGHTPATTADFCQTYAAEPTSSWQSLVERSDLDLIFIATVNRDHAAIARAALQAGKHTVVEYPLAFTVAEAEALIALAQTQNKLLHVEHIEILSGIHEALKQALPQIGTPFHARYTTLNPQRPAPEKWTYQPELFGFPLIGAVSRLQRLIDLLGSVAVVTCQTRYWSREGFALSDWTGLTSAYSACICTAQLQFTSGLIAEVSYGKGEVLWQAARILEIQGEKGGLIFDGDEGQLIQEGQTQKISSTGRRGLFAKDTQKVLDYLLQGSPLYITPEASLYALKVAEAARQASETRQAIHLTALN